MCRIQEYWSSLKCTCYTKKHREGCTRVLLRPGSLITNRARSVRLVIRDTVVYGEKQLLFYTVILKIVDRGYATLHWKNVQ